MTANAIYKYSKLIQPDVWLKPSQIWEVQADCFTLSKTYQCGNAIISQQGDYNGLSLRFPRFVRVRDDKKIRMPLLSFFDMADSEAGNKRGWQVGTEVAEILEMYFH